jgi:hypothetical protein
MPYKYELMDQYSIELGEHFFGKKEKTLHNLHFY